MSLYLDSFTYVNFEEEESFKITLEEIEDDEFKLNDLHTQSGCNTHAQTGCNTHTDRGCDTHRDSGYDNHRDTGCNTHIDSGCNNQGYSRCYNRRTTYDNCSRGIYYAYGDYTRCSNYGCNTHINSGYDNHSDSGCNTHSDSGYDDHSDSGYDNHSDSGYSNHVNYTDNYDPVFGSSIISGDGSTSYNTNIPLTWQAVTDTNTGDTITYYLFYKFKGVTDSGFGDWIITPITNTTQTSYNWNVSLLPAGEYIVRCRAWDGKEWNDNGGTASPVSLTAAEINRSGINSGILTVVHYQAPSWKNPINTGATTLRKEDMDEVRSEVENSRDAYGLSVPSWTDPTILSNQTFEKAVHLTEVRTHANQVHETTGKGAWGWRKASLAKGAKVSADDIKDIRDLLEDL